MTDFIGRAEKETEQILHEFYPNTKIKRQVRLRELIPLDMFMMLDPEIRQHRFDLVVETVPKKMVVEVNYRHGNRAAKKWHNIFRPCLRVAGHIAVAINDYECSSLFRHEKFSEYKIDDADRQDVRNCMSLEGV